MTNNKANHNITEKIVKPHLRTVASSGYGVVLTYDEHSNTATVLAAQQTSDAAGETYYSVPCPLIMGVQSVAPEPGRQCALYFKNGSGKPIITHFFNYMYEQYDYSKQNTAPAPTPYFMRMM